MNIRKQILSIFFIVVVAFFSNSLYAFENGYFKVDDNGWELKQDNNLFFFSIKDYVPEFDEETKLPIKISPYFHIQVEKSDLSRSFNYDPFSGKEQNDYKSFIERGLL